MSSVAHNSSRQWHYVLGDSRLGPIGESNFLRLVEKGKIPLHTEVWYKGLNQWTPLERLLVNSEEPASAPMPELSQPRLSPWLRLLARALDTTILLPFSMWLLMLLPFSVYLPDFLFLLSAMGTAMALEALCISRWGATPAKSLLGIQIKQKNDVNLTFTQAFMRTALAWIMGTGLFCSWAISLAFLWASYNLLTQRGATLWDMEPAYQVLYNPPGFMRKFVATGMFSSLSCLCFMLVG